jgi:YD repeat-containing protein
MRESFVKRIFRGASVLLLAAFAVVSGTSNPAQAQPAHRCVPPDEEGHGEISNFLFSWYQDRGPYFPLPEQVCIFARDLYEDEPEKSMTLGADCYCRRSNGLGSHYIQPYSYLIVDRTHDKPGSCPGYGNPINPLRGNKTQELEIPDGLRGLRVLYDTRSRLAPSAIDRAVGLRFPSGFGPLWSGALERRLVFQPDGSIFAIRGAHHEVSFVQVDGLVSPIDPDVTDRLIASPGQWRYIDAGRQSIDVFNGEGRLMSTSTRVGGQTTYLYSDAQTPASTAPYPGLLIGTVDENGRQVLFRYMPGASGKAVIQQVIGANGLTTSFKYDAHDNLVSVTWPDQRERRYLYENSAHYWALTGMVDENDVRIGTYAYDTDGRAVSTEGAGGVNRFSVAWSTPPKLMSSLVMGPNRRIIRTYWWEPASGIEVTLPNGQVDRLASVAVMGTPRLTDKTQPAGAGCAAANSQSVPDSQGNVVQSDDFNGNRVCRAFDLSRNLETHRIEGLGTQAACASVLQTPSTLPSGSRRISTQWHPDWRIETRMAEPRRIVTSIYNGQPDPFNGNAVTSCAPADALLPDGKPVVVLCKRVEQATTDETGAQGFGAILQSGVAARSTTWTYNATGQVLTETDPRNRLVLTNEYYADTTADHTKGDLKSSKNAAGHTTTFARYDAYGKPLEVVDANTRTTTYAYDPRQRLTSVTTGGSTTTYEYWPTGLLKKTSQADGGEVNYEYDDAHRLVAVSDTRGNRIVYALDANGNRTQESAKDPQGALKRTMSRAFDALGRAQQTTGRD